MSHPELVGQGVFQRTGFPEMFPLERLSADFYYDSGAEPLPGRRY